MNDQERCPKCTSEDRAVRKQIHALNYPETYGPCFDPWHDSAPSSVAEQPQHDPNLAYCPCPSCLEQPPVKQAVQLCKFCDRTETNWRYNRCPNCGELTDKCEMCGQTIGREQAVEGLVEVIRPMLQALRKWFVNSEPYDQLIKEADEALAHYEASRGERQ